MVLNCFSMIGLFNECYPPVMDGVSLTVNNLAKNFHSAGLPVCVVTPWEPGLRKQSSDFPIYSYASLPLPMRHPYRMGMPSLDINFQRQISALPFDIVHAHCPFSSGKTAMRIARQQGIPLVATFHSKFRDDLEKIIPSKTIVDYVIKNIVAFYEHADEVWVPQPSVGETLRSYGYRGELTVVENGSEYAGAPYTEAIKLSARRDLNLAADIPVLLFVGQHIWEKNVKLILQSLAALRNQPFHMLFVGEGYAKEEMQRLAIQLGLVGNADSADDRVTFMGCIHDRERLKNIYLAADLFLFPSLYDNAPLVVREAAAMHTPSLVVRGSNTAEVIQDGSNGFLAENEVEDYSRKLKFLLAHPEEIETAATGAAQSLVRSWEDIAEEVADRYRSLICRHSSYRTLFYAF